MILSDSAILKAIAEGTIVVEPFDIRCLGSNSYDVHLSKHLAVYKIEEMEYSKTRGTYIDSKKNNTIRHFEIPDEGYILLPGRLYLGSTVEYTETHKHVPYLEGKSSIGRLGIDIHATAGKGDVGFCNHWTLELSVTVPVAVYAGMPIGQLIYHSVEGEILTSYNNKKSAKYNGRNPLPKESMQFKNFYHNE